MFQKLNEMSPETIHEEVETCPDLRNKIGIEHLKEYCAGGRGVITLENTSSGNYHTYEFRRPNNPQYFAPDTIFVYTSVGKKKWLYVGMYSSSTQYFKCTRNSQFRYSHEIVKGVIWLCKHIRAGKEVVAPMAVYHEGVCCVCGRRLTTPKSVQTGMGPRCKKLMESKCQ